MTGFDLEWRENPDSLDEQKKVLVIYFRPDTLPKDKAQWLEWAGNYCHATAKLQRMGAFKK